MSGVKAGSLCTSSARAMNGAPDTLVSTTTANVPGHEICDLLVGRVWSFLQHRCGRHYLPALAVAALRNIFRDPRLLKWMQAVHAQPFNRGDVFAGNLRNRRDARTGERTVDVHTARATQSSAAPKLSAG